MIVHHVKSSIKLPSALTGCDLDVGIRDTMKDLFVNFIGATVFSLIGYFYLIGRSKGRFARRFIPQVLEDEAPTSQENVSK